jgi:F0F1-type ATP synthase assembly protein I
MKMTTAPKKTPSPLDGQAKPAKAVDQQSNPRTQFVAAALSMSWQLAIVVLVPIIGGFELDKKLNMLPLLTVVGFLVAMVGMGVVVWRQLQLYAPPMPASQTKGRRS